MTDALAVLVTAPTFDKAAELARTVVEERLAACGNVLGGVRSIYRWEGKVVDEPEVLLLLKTSRELFPRLRDRLLAIHPYEVPEVLAIPVEEGSAGYLRWIEESLAPTA